jgi:hypothetical protein
MYKDAKARMEILLQGEYNIYVFSEEDEDEYLKRLLAIKDVLDEEILSTIKMIEIKEGKYNV